MNPIDRQILQIALPSIVSNITVPLLGLIDVAIVGHLGSPAYIGAIAGRRHAVQYHLLDIRLSAYGNQRHDITGLRQAGPAGNCPPADTFGGDRTCRGIMPYPAASSYQASGFPDYPPHGRSQEMATLYFHICIWGAPLPCWGYTDSPDGTSVCRTPVFPCT